MTDDVMVAPRLSIVLPTYGRPDLLPRAIASVRAQTLTDWELVVVDDNQPGSEARIATESVMRDLGADSRIRYLRHESNQGGGAARNTGIAAARAPLVGFLDDDDEWYPEKAELQVALLANAPDDVALVYCRMLTVDESAGTSSLWPTDGASHGLRHLLRRNTVGSTSCVVCRLPALLAVGMFDAGLPSKQDIDLYVRLAERYDFGFVDQALVARHVHAGASIGKDLSGTILAHRLFYEKHLPMITVYPEVHHYRLASWGGLLAAAGRRREARSVLWRAWRIRPTDLRTVADLLVAHGVPRRFLVALSRRVGGSPGLDGRDATAGGET